MCGRFAQVVKHDQLKKLLDELKIANRDEQIAINFNVAPTQPIAAVIARGDSRLLTFFRWGLIPSWTQEISTKYLMINVRADTILSKPTFKTALIRRRCLIPATGFYEWRQTDKQPFFITAADRSAGCQSCGNGRSAGSASGSTDGLAGLVSGSTDSGLLYFAGIVDYWTGADGSYIQSCAIITTEPNAVMMPIHERMPVILPPETWDTWLQESFADRYSLQALLQPCAPELITAYPVSKFVNSIKNNGEECLTPLSTAI
jgi:putative SOS response-associated peptidase YedK